VNLNIFILSDFVSKLKIDNIKHHIENVISIFYDKNKHAQTVNYKKNRIRIEGQGMELPQSYSPVSLDRKASICRTQRDEKL
jgi:hypothetical protein